MSIKSNVVKPNRVKHVIVEPNRVKPNAEEWCVINSTYNIEKLRKGGKVRKTEKEFKVCPVCFKATQLWINSSYPICSDCLPKIPGYNKDKKMNKIFVCNTHGFYIGHNGNFTECPECNREKRMVNCSVCGKKFYYSGGHLDRKNNKVCPTCQESLPGKGKTLNKCAVCGIYYKSEHNFESCPVCGSAGNYYEITCKRCGKEHVQARNSASSYCLDCDEELKNELSPACEDFNNKIKVRGVSRKISPRSGIEMLLLPLAPLQERIASIYHEDNSMESKSISTRHEEASTDSKSTLTAQQEAYMDLKDISANKKILPKYNKKTCIHCGRTYTPLSGYSNGCGSCQPILTCSYCNHQFLGKWAKISNEYNSNENNDSNQKLHFCCQSHRAKYWASKLDNLSSFREDWMNLTVDMFDESILANGENIDINNFKIIDDNNVDKYNIPGVWGWKIGNIVLDVHQCQNILKEYINNKILFQNPGKNEKYKRMKSFIEEECSNDGFKEPEAFFVFSSGDLKQRFDIELAIAVKTKAKFWCPAPGYQNDIIQKKLNRI